MVTLKSVTALVIVFLGQSNFFSHRYSYLTEKLSHKKDRQVELEDKKTASKQGISRFSDNSKVGIKKVFLKSFPQNIQALINPINFTLVLKDVAQLESNKFRLMLFGCC